VLAEVAMEEIEGGVGARSCSRPRLGAGGARWKKPPLVLGRERTKCWC
jgi:hypothetical protein